MTQVRRFSLVKPTVETRYHIDFDWWKQNDREYRVYLRSLLPPEYEEAVKDLDEDEVVDWVDPETAEVHQVDAMQHLLMSEIAQQPDFLTERTAVVEAIFRLLLQNGNAPLSVQEIGERLGRNPTQILRTLSGTRVYRGLRPVME